MRVMLIGGTEVSVSRAAIGVVLKAPVMRHSALFCTHSRMFLMLVDLLFQKAAWPYVVIGRMAPKYICLR